MAVYGGPRPNFDLTTNTTNPIKYSYGPMDHRWGGDHYRYCIRRYSAIYISNLGIFQYLKTYDGIRNNQDYQETSVIDVGDVNTRASAHGNEIIGASEPDFSIDTLFKLVFQNPNHNMIYFIDTSYIIHKNYDIDPSRPLRHTKDRIVYRYGILQNNNVKVMKTTNFDRRPTTF